MRPGNIFGAHGARLIRDRLLSAVGPVALTLLVLLFSFATFIWNSKNTAVMAHPLDSYVYLARTVSFCNGLSSVQDFGDFVDKVQRLSFGRRPVLYQLLSVPLMITFGYSEDVALCLNIIFGAILILSTFALGSLVQSKSAGLLAALLVVSYPPIVHLSHVFRPHAALPACTALSLWLLLRFLYRWSIKGALLLGLSLGAGALVHPKFLWVMMPSAVLSVCYYILRRSCRSYSSRLRLSLSRLEGKSFCLYGVRKLIPVILVFLASISVWLAVSGVSLNAVLQLFVHVLGLFSGPVRAFGMRSPEPSFWWYAHTAPNALSAILAFFALVGVVAIFFRKDLGSRVMLISVLSGYLAWSCYINLAWWYMASALPAVAVVTALWIDSLPTKWFAVPISLVCFCVAVFNFYVVSYGGGARLLGVAQALGAVSNLKSCSEAMVFCPNPPRVEPLPVGDVIEEVLGDSSCGAVEPCRLSVDRDMVAIFRYHMAKFHPGTHLVISHVFPPYNGPGVYDYSALLDNDYFLIMFLRGKVGSGRNRLSAMSIFLRFLSSPSTSFKESYEVVASYGGPYSRRGVLLKRVKPLVADDFVLAREQLSAKFESARLTSEAVALSGQDPSAGIALFLRTLDIDPHFNEARIGLAQTYHRTGEYEKAASVLGDISDFDSDDPRPQVTLGVIYMSQGRVEDGAIMFREALEIAPEHLSARIGLAQAYQNKGRYADAVRALGDLSDFGEDDPRPRITLGAIYLSQQRVDAAIELFQQALEIDPASSDAKRGLEQASMER